MNGKLQAVSSRLNDFTQKQFSLRAILGNHQIQKAQGLSQGEFADTVFELDVHLQNHSLAVAENDANGSFIKKGMECRDSAFFTRKHRLGK